MTAAGAPRRTIRERIQSIYKAAAKKGLLNDEQLQEKMAKMNEVLERFAGREEEVLIPSLLTKYKFEIEPEEIVS
jgi:hypothetical protein